MSVTIIIPTINEPMLERVIRAAKSELPEAEIIVVGFGPSAQVAGSCSVTFLDMRQKTPKPVGINRAVRMAKYPWLIVLDADAIPQAGWGGQMLRNFQEGRMVFSGSLSMTEGNIWMKAYNLSSLHEFLAENRPEERKHLPALNLGLTRQAYELGGAWDESLVRSQDYEWTLRLFGKGVKLWFDPRPCVLHIPISQDTFPKLWRAWERNGYYNWLIRKRYSQVLGTPGILQNPTLVLLLAPLLSIIPTARIFRTSPKNFLKYIYIIPLVYLTKIAWCWGVYKASVSRKPK